MSVSRMIKDSFDRRGIADEAVQEKERRGIIANLKASDLGDDLGLYIRAFGGRPKADKGNPSKRNKIEPSKREKRESAKGEVSNPTEQKDECIDIYTGGRRLPGSYGSNQ
jgi:hypothetical protein